MRPGKLLAPLGLLLLALGLVAVGFAPAVRARINEKAARYGATVSILRVRPSWLGVHLEGIDVRFADAPSLQIHLEEVAISMTPSGMLKGIHVLGGDISGKGSLKLIQTEIQTLADRFSGKGGNSGKGAELDVSGIQARWSHEEESAIVSGISLKRSAEGWNLLFSSTEWKLPSLRVSVEGGDVVFHRTQNGARFFRWKTQQISLDAMLVEEPPPVLPVGIQGIAPSSALSKPPPNPSGSVNPLWQEKVQHWKERIHQIVQGVLATTVVGSSVEVKRIQVTLHRGKEILHIGPGALSLQTSERGIKVDLAPLHAGEGSTPLLLSADLPSAKEEMLAFKINGGPVTLAMLGIQEGDFGLLDVGQASIEAGGEVKLASDASSVEVNLHGLARGLSLEHKKLSTEPVRGLDLRFMWIGGAKLDGSHVFIKQGEFGVGKVHLEVMGSLERSGESKQIQGKFSVPLASCQAALDGLPSGLAPTLVGMKMSGTFSVGGKVYFDSKQPDKAQIDFQFLNDCRVTAAPSTVDVARFRQPFRRHVYDAAGKLVEVETGPGTPGWVSLPGITPFMEAAVLTTEDGGFRRHRGFDLEAIRNSIRENLKTGRFLRGASTISMQTAKNLYLYRDKTIGRKLQEAFLTMYLEQVLSKDQILELYLNCIEFGPMIYGIGPAAQHYFKTSAGELSLGQSLYLASILPNPKKQHFGADNKVGSAFMGYLHRLMRGMAKRNLIREDELEDGLSEWVVFGQPPAQRNREKLPDSLEDPGEDALPPDTPRELG